MTTTVYIDDEGVELIEEVRDLYDEIGFAKPKKTELIKKALKNHKEDLRSNSGD